MEKGKKVVVMLTKVFFSEHPKSGQETHFADLVKAGKKIHTCRDNFNYWAEKIASLKRTGGVLSVRQWSGKPYRSPQEIVVEIPASKVGVSELIVERIFIPSVHLRPSEMTAYKASIGDTQIDIKKLAKNDGFSYEGDFVSFINPLFNKYQRNIIRLAIIHFNEFEY